MSVETPLHLSEDEIETTWKDGAPVASTAPQDADGTDGDAGDGDAGDGDAGDGDATDTTDGDAGDADDQDV